MVPCPIESLRITKQGCRSLFAVNVPNYKYSLDTNKTALALQQKTINLLIKGTFKKQTYRHKTNIKIVKRMY